MRNIFRPALALACGISLAFPALTQAQEVTADTVVATVGGVDITAGHLHALRAQLPPQYQALPDNQLYAGLLEQLVQQQALAQEMGEPSPSVQRILDNEIRALFASVIISRVSEAAVTEEKLREAYDTQFANSDPAPEFNASHILVDSQEAADDIKRLLDEGADFAELAQARSTGPSGPNGGELGWFGPGMMVAPFEEAVAGLVAGEVSDPVQTQFGWHVIKLNDSRLQAPPSFEEVAGELAGELQTEAVQAYIDEALVGLEIEQKELDEIDPSFLSNPGLFEE